MIGWTLCSGIGAPEMAAPDIDWRLASDIEPFPRAVLQSRFGYSGASMWSDFSALRIRHARRFGIPLPDLIMAGTPCQSFSVAGRRGGLGDARGNLTLDFVRLLHAIVNARPSGQLCAVWENVPGVLSDKGNAFGCFMAGLVGAVDALQPPGGKSWPGEGMVQGPRARLAWATLDAQWFGVAQRRRRVLVVVDFGGCIDPAAVLLEPDRLRGDTAPRREAGSATSALTANGVGVCGADDNQAQQGHLIPSSDWPAEVSPPLDTRMMRSQGCENQHIQNGAGMFVPGAFGGNNTAGPIDVSPALTAHPGGSRRLDFESEAFITSFDCKGTQVSFEKDGIAGALRSMGHSGSHQSAGGHSAIAIQERAVSENPHAGPDGAGFRTDDCAYTLEARTTAQAVQFHHAVRRLTPTECHRLQGFPDGHCAIQMGRRVRKAVESEFRDYIDAQRDLQNLPPIDDHSFSHMAADGPQYKALGNSMAVPVVKWVLDRCKISMAHEKSLANAAQAL